MARLPEPVGSLFPFDRVRPSQAAFLDDARRAIADGKHLVAHAPTGLGKTAVALAAGLEVARPEGKLVLFLTSKQSQHRIAIETLQRMEARGVVLRVVDVIGKHAMCLQPAAPRGGRAFHAFCDLKVSTRSCSFYATAATDAATEIRARPIHVQDLIRASERHGTCPYKAALEAGKDADVVVCDYNYVFSAIQERIFARIGRGLGDAVLLIDEAHNLPDRIRSQLCGDLSLFGAMRAAKEAGEVDRRLAAELHAVAGALQAALRSIRRETRVTRDFLPEILESASRGGPLLRCADLATDCTRAGEALVREGRQTILLEVGSFFRMWEGRDEGVLRVAEGGPEKRIAYRLLDPSILSRAVFRAVHASVLMSGTLHPAEMYADLLGLEPKRRVLRAYRSPFPHENRLLLVTPQITTSYARRDERMYLQIANELARFAAAVPGNVAAFFPSYDLMERVLARVRWSAMPKELLVERRTWGKTERDHSVQWLREHAVTGGLLVGVLGGGLSEGVDYRDNVLGAVCVVGLPLSPPTLEVEALKAYYAQKFGGDKGYEYAVVYPALNKVLQAAGRPIRGETDRAIIVLMDRRYLEPRYAAGMPPDFAYRASDDIAREAIAFHTGGRRPGDTET
ncbi:MAG TPA: ATP-dependent DNA helicase [Thermoplasmata archaeon]|nr:ATP-dependent DNA helicase [Thermoplasmata archaeon]